MEQNRPKHCCGLLRTKILKFGFFESIWTKKKKLAKGLKSQPEYHSSVNSYKTNYVKGFHVTPSTLSAIQGWNWIKGGGRVDTVYIQVCLCCVIICISE